MFPFSSQISLDYKMSLPTSNRSIVLPFLFFLIVFTDHAHQQSTLIMTALAFLIGLYYNMEVTLFLFPETTPLLTSLLPHVVLLCLFWSALRYHKVAVHSPIQTITVFVSIVWVMATFNRGTWERYERTMARNDLVMNHIDLR